MPFVQSGSSFPATTASANTLAVTLTGVTAGNLLCAFVAIGNQTSGVPAITDDKGNTWVAVHQRDSTNAAAPRRLMTFYAKNVVVGTTVITAAWTTATTRRAMIVHEVSGCDTIAPLDVSASNAQMAPGPGPNTDAVTSTAATTTVNGCYIFGVHCDGTGTTNTILAGTNFTGREARSGSGGPPLLRSQDLTQAVAGSIASTGTTTSANDDWFSFMLAFKPASGGANPVPVIDHYRRLMEQ